MSTLVYGVGVPTSKKELAPSSFSGGSREADGVYGTKLKALSPLHPIKQNKNFQFIIQKAEGTHISKNLRKNTLPSLQGRGVHLSGRGGCSHQQKRACPKFVFGRYYSTRRTVSAKHNNYYPPSKGGWGDVYIKLHTTKKHQSQHYL